MFQLTFLLCLAHLGWTDPVSYWSFDAIDDSMVLESESDLNLFISGASISQGALNGGLYFDGIDDFAFSDSIESVRQTIGTLHEGTISAWFRFDSHPGFMDIETIFYLGAENTYSNFGTSANCYELEVGHFNSEKRLYWTNISTPKEDTSVPLCWSTTNELGIGSWYHVVSATSDLGTHVYINNVEIYNSAGLTWQFGNDSMRRFLYDVVQQEVLWFGKGLWNNEPQYFEGVIDEFKIWDYSISSEEVTEEYERVASTGSLLIDDYFPQECILDESDFELHGSFHNIVKLQWQIGSGDVITEYINDIGTTWNLLINEEVPPGRHEIKVIGRNATNRPFSDSRMLVQPDMNSDQKVDIQDLLLLFNNWGICNCPEDLSGNGEVDIPDILILIGSWS